MIAEAPIVNKFTHELFGEIRVTDQDGELWFVAKDVLDVLELRNTTEALRGLEADEKSTIRISEGTVGGNPNKSIINESGLYSLILRSNKPEAKAFKKWVTSEVLPSIRKTGGYSASVPGNFAEALRLAADQAEQIEQQTARITDMTPKEEFYDAVTASDEVCQLAIVCQMVDGLPGRNRMFKTLRDDGILIASGERKNLPKQRYVDQGLFVVKESKWEHDGKCGVSYTPMVTQEGVDWIRKRYGSE